MATVTKTFNFNVDTETFILTSQVGGAGTGDFVFDAGGFSKFTYSYGTATLESFDLYAQLSATQTFEDWGVPANSTMLSAQILDVYINTPNLSDRDLDTASLTVSLLDDSQGLIAKLLNAYAIPVIDNSTYFYDTFYGAGTANAVNLAGYNSYQALILELQMNYATLGNNNSFLENGIIDLQIELTYTPPAATTKYYLIT